MPYFILVLTLVIAAFSYGCNKPIPETEKVEVTPTIPVKETPTAGDQMRAAPDWRSAVAVARPYMKDTFNETSQGTILLFPWAVDKMSFADVDANETDYKTAMKYMDGARGQRMCVSGMIFEIEAGQTNWGRISTGSIFVPETREVYSVYGVKSSGNLVDESMARFCGIITGKNSYSNSGGGITHTISLVGMFDLPENH